MKKKQGTKLREETYISIISKRKKVTINLNTILYIVMRRKNAEIHTLGGRVYETRMSLGELEESLGEGFIKIHRGCLVSVMSIHDITDTVNLNNGEHLEYTIRKKKWITERIHVRQKRIVNSLIQDGIPRTDEEYRLYYASFECLPVAFADIEMVFNDERRAVDWIFKYANKKLAELEKVPLQQLIGSSFSGLFCNMDAKWLQAYERATLFGETLEMMEYSPEIDTYLKVICFPTFKGHCGCMLFDLNHIQFLKSSEETKQIWARYTDELNDTGI